MATKTKGANNSTQPASAMPTTGAATPAKGGKKAARKKGPRARKN